MRYIRTSAYLVGNAPLCSAAAHGAPAVGRMAMANVAEPLDLSVAYPKKPTRGIVRQYKSESQQWPAPNISPIQLQRNA